MTDTLHEAKRAHQAGNLPKAEHLYRQALELPATQADALRLLGVLKAQMKDYAAAEELLLRAVQITPQDASVHFNLALIHLTNGRLEKAAYSAEVALELNPAHLPARAARAKAYLDMNRHQEALEELDRVLAVAPHDTNASYWRGIALVSLKRAEEAFASFQKAYSVGQDLRALIGRAVALQALGRTQEAIWDFQEALRRDPQNGLLYLNYADILMVAGLNREAIQAYDAAMKLDPSLPRLHGNRHYAKMKIGDWLGYDADLAEIQSRVRAGQFAASTLITIDTDPELQQTCARLHAAKIAIADTPLWQGERYNHTRIRVAYISKDLRDHPNITLATELFERHDRAAIEIFAISVGPDDKSAARARLEAAFEHFHQVPDLPEHDVAALLRRLEIDIAVDLDGYSLDAKPKIFAYRPAPVSVNFLGYPGTVGAPYMDYIIADQTVIPDNERQFYDEKVVYMPHTYQANTRRPISSEPMTRAQHGLPENAFVFCCFNSSHKITPPIFDIWMRLLKRVDGSVLWLLSTDPALQNNLRQEAKARGAAPERLVFAARLNHDKHLARHRLADLFLDTLPYNAHTTASDALWAGLPVLTRVGNNFPGRVGASLLKAMGLEELITNSAQDYEGLAMDLAQSPSRLAILRERIAQNRETHPLFDGNAYARALEDAYRSMLDRRNSGKAPESFSVA